MHYMRTLLTVLAYVGFGVAGQLIRSHSMRQMPDVNGFQFSEGVRLVRYALTTPGMIARWRSVGSASY